jgi:hypothetical protein
MDLEEELDKLKIITATLARAVLMLSDGYSGSAKEAINELLKDIDIDAGDDNEERNGK